MKPKKLTGKEKKEFENRFGMIMCKDFEFDINQELLVYQYVVGKNLAEKEIENYPQDRAEETLSEWEKEIRNKYSNRGKDYLVEFENYLNVGINSCDINSDLRNVLVTAIVSAAFGAYLTVLVQALLERHSYCSFALMVIVVLLGCFYIAKKVGNYIIKNALKKQMYIKYRDNIRFLISHK